ncbi:nitrate/nitrite transporter [Arcicella rosea]|uniref:MFS family permease n=1 Tax=Arcicella rosea TaxID=502909 RepID=A0A841EWY7_9BACT|nr:MFS transporter [Arcicella rosea]MBB6003981.1 MFS family permease [Arcicella rosea]
MKPRYLLPVVIFAQFAGTSLWFALNAVLKDLQVLYPNTSNFLGNMTSAVQFGFVVGTAIYAIFTLSDKFSPVKVFVISTLIAAGFNLIIVWIKLDFKALLIIRFLVGFFLAGVYPVGMKIMADWYEKGLGRALGYLVGALVLGTSFPHFIAYFSLKIHWQSVIIATSIIASSGALMMLLLIKDGPFRKKAGKFNPNSIVASFKNPSFRTFSFGYFGHMFEVYTFWAYVPLILQQYNQHSNFHFNTSLWSFLIIAAGLLACVLTGEFSAKFGSAKLAFLCLSLSLICCLLSVCFSQANPFVFITIMLIWGMSVAGDSPQFSTLISQNTNPEYRASSITIVNCIGFAITIVSLQILQLASKYISNNYIYLILSFGPVIGLINTFNRTFLVKNNV